MKRICISCGAQSQRYGKSWELWGQCANCAKRSNPRFLQCAKMSRMRTDKQQHNCIVLETVWKMWKVYLQDRRSQKTRIMQGLQ